MKSITGNTKLGEIKEWEKLESGIEKVFQPKYESSIKKAMVLSAKAYEENNQYDLVNININHQDEIRKLLKSNWNESGKTFAFRIVDAVEEYQKKGAKEDFKAFMDIYISEFLAEKVKQITDTTKSQIENIVSRMSERGDSIEMIAEEIRNLSESFSLYRSHMIARTETHNLANYGNQIGAELTEVELEKGWVFSKDDRARESHKINQVVGLKDYFIVGGERLMYPGDPKGSAKNIIGCRCVVAYYPVE